MEGDAGLGLYHHSHGVMHQVCSGQENAVLVGSVQRAFAL
jgi:hypothetical protein